MLRKSRRVSTAETLRYHYDTRVAMSFGLTTPSRSLLKPSHEILEDLQAVLRIVGGKRSAFGMRHQAQDEAGFIGDPCDGVRRTIRVARIFHRRLALHVTVAENHPWRG